MFSEKLLSEFNVQVKHEFYSANFYIAMAAYCKELELDGFANFFIVQAEEERFHAMKFFNFINEIGGRVKITAYDEPQNDFASLEEVFATALKHEQFVTDRINFLMEIAINDKNYACQSFLNWFVDEQVEELSMFTTLLNKLKRIGENGHAIYMLDAELAARVFTPPVEK